MKEILVKNWLLLILVLLLLSITGCFNYKEVNTENSAELNLQKEIEAIERELTTANSTGPLKQQVTEEVALTNKNQTESAEQVISVKENQKVVLTPKVVDPDNDKVTVTFSAPLNSRGEWQTSYGDAGEYAVIITAEDGVTTSSKTVKIVVEKVNVPPVISNIKDITINEGETVAFTPTAKDPNGDQVTVEVSQPLNEGTFRSDFKSEGIYQITVTASDGELKASQSFTLTVNNVNQKPVLSGLENSITLKEGELLWLQPTVNDADGDDVKVSFNGPVDKDGTWKPSYTDHGEYEVTVTADDGQDKAAQRIKIIVTDVNAPVEFLDIAVEVN